MRYPLAERFKAPQGEGLYAGTQMAFVRLVGCSVGQGVCTACDTDFDTMRQPLGGGLFDVAEILAWAAPCRHLCVTGGEPLDRRLEPLLMAAEEAGLMSHVETSGTRLPDWLSPLPSYRAGFHYVFDQYGREIARQAWITVSPKPGFRPELIRMADEVKVIIGGLGTGPGWPTVKDALAWADRGKLVYVQPRNSRLDVDRANLDEALRIVEQYPQLRLSVQLHKFIRTR